MALFRGNNINQIYREMLLTVSQTGILEGKTRDLLSTQVVLTDPTFNLIGLDKNWRWCFQELLDRMSGSVVSGFPSSRQNPGLAFIYRPAWKAKLAKEKGRFHYSYGDIYKDQVPAIIKQLKSTKTSREAILNMWHGDYLLNQKTYNRRPCTLTIHFMVREKKLHCWVNMRSNDIINLFPYDVFHHTMLQQYIAARLGLGLGHYHHSSSHSYYPKKRERAGRRFLEKTIEKLGEFILDRDGNNSISFGEYKNSMRTDPELFDSELTGLMTLAYTRPMSLEAKQKITSSITSPLFIKIKKVLFD